MTIASTLASDVIRTLHESANDEAYPTFDKNGQSAETIGPEIIEACLAAINGDIVTDQINALIDSGLSPLEAPMRFTSEAISAAQEAGLDVSGDKISYFDALAFVRDAAV